MNTATRDAFDQWWQWANEPVASPLTIPEIHDAVMMLTDEEREDRAVVNGTVRTVAARGARGSADRYGVPMATE